MLTLLGFVQFKADPFKLLADNFAMCSHNYVWRFQIPMFASITKCENTLVYSFNYSFSFYIFYCFLFQVPCSYWSENTTDYSATAVQKSLLHFQLEIPVLELIGTPHLIHHQTPLFVDEDVQLVCKYLRAYHDQTHRGINQLFVECKDSFFIFIFIFLLPLY